MKIKVQQMQIRIDQSTDENSDLKTENLALKAKISSLDASIVSLNLRIESLTIEISHTGDARNVAKNDNEDLHEKILSLEEELYESKQVTVDLLEQLRDLEFQLQSAQAKIAELMSQIEQLEKNQAIYIPKKNDNIDLALAHFINKFPEREKMNILFLRESEGVYQFGQKRVYVKIEKGNQVQVRVGGGYMHIDEFIRLYTPQEVDKIERKDVI